ncbi:uncharacterized protein E0L32_012225 [Thyridium curvatum]|uniref:C3H1-type domain-containing protein n=1 Tax=Thyridium curvatum TaxID=1093900 RepID=A0A507BJS4_9PEZI|nr:uncharacterized protein E0L32_012225 [Thyridium curvatum]TPX17311.1 hypothetical protein E0L32_012225 [Thyridium curvatum]
MLSDKDLERATSQLADYRRSDALTQILEQYSTLLEDYRRLRSDYEEEREAREKYKQLARGQERNPFVLVLVDGDGYVLHDNFISKGADGGSSAAKMLNEAVKTSLRHKGLEHCQVMVRIYANVAGLSKALHKAGVAGAEKRSIAPFIAGFNRSYGLADFVDAGELKENADFKLRALLHLYAENAQCKHIYFAACHDVGYISDLTPHTGNSSRFTLVSAPGVRVHNEFTKLGMGIEEFPGVFRHEHLEPVSARPTAVFASAKVSTSHSQKPLAVDTSEYALPPPGADSQKAVCQFFPLGKCRYGKDCKNLHIAKDRASINATWRSASNNPQSDATDRKSRPATIFDADSKNDYHNRPSPLGIPVTHKLPRKDAIPDGFVAVNKNNYRLDPFIPPCSAEALNGLKSRSRVCNNFQLTGFCEHGDKCPYSHEPLDAETKRALEALARSMPCSKRGDCRNSACTMGHICQRLDCKHRGGKLYCKLPYLSHLEDLAVESYVPAARPSYSRRPTLSNGSIIGDDDSRRLSPVVSDEGEERFSFSEFNGALIDSDDILRGSQPDSPE